MANLREQTPQEFSDDVRWYKIFSQRLFATLLVECAVCFLICKILSVISTVLMIVGIIVSALLFLFTFIILSVPVPGEDIARGDGMLLEEYLYRRYVHKKRGAIYIKTEEEGEIVF